MNKRQKEVIQSQLKAEKKVLKQIEKQYTAALNDINTKIRILQSDELTQSRIYRIEHQKALKSQVSGILDKLHSEEYSTIDQFLKDSYTSGFIGTTYDLFGQGVPLIMPIDPKEAVRAVMTDSKISGGLYNSLGVDVKKLKKSISAEISRGLASDMSYEDITRNIANTTKAPLSRARTIVLTETHRIKQASTRDVQVKAKEKGADVLKQWNSTLDGETRKTHRKLDGQIREVDEPFEMDGKEAMYPGDFNDPAEDCNCRCESLTRARWALGEDELQTLKERAEFFGLDKTKDFEDFKGKYLKASGVHSVGTIEKPIRPKKRNFDSDESYQTALDNYRDLKNKYDEQFDEIIQNALNATPVFQTKEQVVEWTKKTGITIDNKVLETVDLRAFNEVKTTLEEMLVKYPALKSYEIEDFTGKKFKTVFNIGLTDDGLLSANGGFNFNQRLFQDYEHGLREGLELMTTDFNVRGDGSFSTIVRHEFGHNVQSYIENNISSKYHHNVDDWKINFKTFDEWKAADKAYWDERHKYQTELVSLANLKGASEYSQTNELELFAEGFAEYTSGGNSEFGKAFGEFLDRWYK